MNLESEIRDGLTAARKAAKSLALASTERKNLGLEALAKSLRTATPEILEANRKDLEAARADGAGQSDPITRVVTTPRSSATSSPPSVRGSFSTTENSDRSSLASINGASS